MAQDRVFLSYAREDIESARRLCAALRSHGIKVWFDVDSLTPGARWKDEIYRAIRESRYFLPLLSVNSVSKRGFVQAEMKEGLELLREFPATEVFIIPVRLDACQPSDAQLEALNWVDLFPDWKAGEDRLVRFLAHPALRFDGIYVSEPEPGAAQLVWNYLRFYEDGDAIYGFVLKKRELERALGKFRRNQSFVSRGTYRLSGEEIRFTMKSKSGEVDYQGAVVAGGLVLRFYSHINGNSGTREFSFQRR